MIPYFYIPLISSLILRLVYATNAEASSRSRLIVSVIVAVSAAIWWWYSQWLLLATLLQAGVSIYVLLYLKVHK